MYKSFRALTSLDVLGRLNRTSSSHDVDRRRFLKVLAASFALGSIDLAGCRRLVQMPRMVPVRPAPIEDLSFLQRQDVGNPIADHPWIAYVRAVDLDGDGLMDILACEAKDNQLLWLRQTVPGKFEEHVIASLELSMLRLRI